MEDREIDDDILKLLSLDKKEDESPVSEKVDESPLSEDINLIKPKFEIEEIDLKTVKADFKIGDFTLAKNVNVVKDNIKNKVKASYYYSNYEEFYFKSATDLVVRKGFDAFKFVNIFMKNSDECVIVDKTEDLSLYDFHKLVNQSVDELFMKTKFNKRLDEVVFYSNDKEIFNLMCNNLARNEIKFTTTFYNRSFMIDKIEHFKRRMEKSQDDREKEKLYNAIDSVEKLYDFYNISGLFKTQEEIKKENEQSILSHKSSIELLKKL